MTALELFLLGVIVIGALVVFSKRRKPAPPAAVERVPYEPPLPAALTRRVPITSSDRFNVVGEASYQGLLRKIDGGRLRNGETVAFTALVCPEQNNRYDPNAIMVCADGLGKVGYFSRDHAMLYCDFARALTKIGAVAECEAFLIGGREDAPTIGVMLYFPDDEDEALRQVVEAGA